MSFDRDQLKSVALIGALVALCAAGVSFVLYLGSQLQWARSTQLGLIGAMLLVSSTAIVADRVIKRPIAKAARTKVPVVPPNPARTFPELERDAAVAVNWLRDKGVTLYSRPWYMITGPPGSGKSSLLRSSGLHLHTLPGQTSAGLEETAACEWRVTDEAVLLDTAERYQTENPTDLDEWLGLIELLKRHREQRPLDGLLIAVNTADIIDAESDQTLQQRAKTLRDRLDELISRTGMSFPVYLVFTHAEKIDGFAEFFRDFNQEERAQVWGETFPVDQASQARDRLEMVFDALYHRLLRRRLVRLGEDAVLGKKKIFVDLPEETPLGQRIRESLFNSLSASNRFAPTHKRDEADVRLVVSVAQAQTGAVNTMLEKASVVVQLINARGEVIWPLTPANHSSEYQGPTADVTARIAKDLLSEQLHIFNFPIRFYSNHRKLTDFIGSLFRPNPYSKIQPLLRGFYFTAHLPATTQREGYFTTDLFHQVLIGDRYLAESLQTGPDYRYLLRQLLAVAAAGLLFLCTVGLFVSFSKNRGLIPEGQRLGTEVMKVSGAAQKDQTATREELEALENLRRFLDGYNHPPDLSHRFGLYSGGRISQPLRGIYFEAISQRFFNPAAGDLETDLRKFADEAANACGAPEGGVLSEKAVECYDRYYDLLRTYLMLSLPDKDKVEPKSLQRQLANYWKKYAPGDDGQEWQRQLEFYSQQAASPDAPHWKPETKLVEKVRSSFQSNYPPDNRYYKVITGRTDKEVGNFTLASIIPRSDWLTGSPVVPGSFTPDGYKRMRERMGSTSEEIEAEGWVVPLPPEAKRRSIDTGKLQRLYATEYAAEWEKFLADLEVRQFKSPDDASKALRELAGESSPLAEVMKAVAEQTKPAAASSSSGLLGKLAGAGSPNAGDPLAEVGEKFKPLADLLASGIMKKYFDTLNKLQQALAVRKGQALTPEAIKLPEAEQEIEQQLEPLKNGPAKAAADLLRQPLLNLRAYLEGDELTKIREKWRGLEGRLKNLVADYPFAVNNDDAKYVELKALFHPVDGELTKFVRQDLANKLEFDSAQRRWRRKPGETLPLDEFVTYINHAWRLGEAFFPNNSAGVNVGYNLTLAPPGPDTQVVIEVGDGKKVDSQSSRSATGAWSPENSAGARITIRQGDVASEPREFTGTWGLFRMVDAGGRNKGGDKYVLTWNVQGVAVQATLKPMNSVDPFERELFTPLLKVPPLR